MALDAFGFDWQTIQYLTDEWEGFDLDSNLPLALKSYRNFGKKMGRLGFYLI